MIIISLLLVLGSAALLATGVVEDNHQLVWASIGASVVAAAALTASVFYRRVRIPGTRSVGSASGGGDPHQPPAAPPSTAPPSTAPFAASEPVNVEAAEPPAGAVSDAADYPDPPDEPLEEDVSAPDALRVVDVEDEVMVVDGRPRYHLAGCPHLSGKEAVPLPRLEAREAGFTPCSRCAPDATFADAIRRRAAGG